MSVLQNRMRATLLNLSGKDFKHLLENLNTLTDLIENKSDPDQNELYILENLYKTQEDLNLLVENLKKYNIDSPVFSNSGSKLSDLFSKNNFYS